ncbi:MAG TPA: aminotransferase class I/II-fold pyridoxal phosphate-dependent enzyme [Cytophagaceae bacterium]|jgi:7-keto-8-aminopelargonate synthetase-like enzyme/predicted N-acyltransferase
MKKNSQHENFLKTFNEISTIARQRKIAHLTIEDDELNGRYVTIEGRKKLHFGSCSYLGLELDERVIDGSIKAVRKYGAQFSCSRAYLSCTPYEELEELLSRVFNNPVFLNTSSTLAHQSVLPLIIEDGDAVIFDQQVHSSVQELKYKLHFRGIDISISRHNNLEELQNKIDLLSKSHNRIWYLVDGTYSMYGDLAPARELAALLERNKKLFLYVDDAHSISVFGKHGKGYFLDNLPNSAKMIVTASLAKGFGSAGGITIIPKELDDLYWKVKNCAGPYTFSGPQQPSVLGASIESAKIHLTPEISDFQRELQHKIHFCNELINYYGLPLVADTTTPIFFIGLGLTRVGYNMASRMANEDLYLNLGIFPAVSENNTGLRFTITRHHKEKDIEKLIERINHHLPLALLEEGRSMKDIWRSFKNIKKNEIKTLPVKTQIKLAKVPDFTIQRETTIRDINKDLWNGIFSHEGNFDWDALQLYENAFSQNKNPESNWDFRYYIIKDSFGRPVISTFLTCVITKDDMLSPDYISKEIERERTKNNYYLTSKTFMMGCQVTEGNHLFIDKSNPAWKLALMELLDAVWVDQDNLQCDSLFFRDFNATDEELKDFFMEQGFVKIDMPASNYVDVNWSSKEEYIQHLPSKKRLHLKKNVLRHEDKFDIEIVEAPTNDQIQKWYNLYDNVRRRNFQINGFKLPEKLFHLIAVNSQWDCMEFNIEKDGEKIPVAIIFAYKNSNYSNAIIGLDYDYLAEYNIYRQTLYQTILKGIDLKVKKVFFGLTADFEKNKVGAVSVAKMGFVQNKDTYNTSLLSLISKKQEKISA